MSRFHICYRTANLLSQRSISRPSIPALRAGNSLNESLRDRTFPKRTMATAMAKRLEGKTVLVTGASAGIGKSIAQEFARTSPKNLKLIITARRVERLKELEKEIADEVGGGVKVLSVQLDVSNPKEIENFVQNVPAEFRDIDVLVNNA